MHIRYPDQGGGRTKGKRREEGEEEGRREEGKKGKRRTKGKKGKRKGKSGERRTRGRRRVYSLAMNAADAGRGLQSFQSLGSCNGVTCLLQYQKTWFSLV